MPENKTLEFLAKQKTLIMATVAKDGTPTASYAPFVYHDNCFYVYTSDLSQHTKNLVETSRASLLFIEDERDAGNMFARKRLTLLATSNVIIEAKTNEWCLLIDLFKKKFGKVFDLILPLQDFTLFELQPEEGRSVVGFGQAYRVNANLERLERITGPGHKKRGIGKKVAKKKGKKK